MSRRKPFSFNEVHLSVPESWELARFNGGRQEGELTLDDGTRTVLQAEWKPKERYSRDAIVRAFQRTMTGYELVQRLDLDEKTALVQMKSSAGRLSAAVVMDPARNRYIVLRLPNAKGRLRSTIEPILKRHRRIDASELQPWCFFATRFLLSPEFRLQKAQMQTGCICLPFLRNGRHLTIWDISLLRMAERQGQAANLAIRVVDEQYKRRFRFPQPKGPAGVLGGCDSAAFALKGTLRGQHGLRLIRRIAGNHRLLLESVPNRTRNRLGLVFLQYRQVDELEWIEPVLRSLSEPREELE
jgi:hypothetical protein